MVFELKNLEFLQEKGNSIRNFKPSEKEERQQLLEQEFSQISSKLIEFPHNYQELEKAITNYKPNKSELKKLDASTILKSKKEILQNALKIVCENLDAQTAAIFLISKNGILERFGIYGFDKYARPVDDNWFSEEKYIVGESFTGKAVKSQEDSNYGEIQYSSTLSDENLKPEHKEKYLDKFGRLDCGIAIPLNGTNRTYGVLRVINKNYQKVELGTQPYFSEDSFSDKDVYLLVFLATNIANTLSNFRRDVQVEILNYLSYLLIQPSQTTEEYLKNICQQVIDLFIKNPEMGFKAGILRVKDDTSDSLEVKATSFEYGVSDKRNNNNRRRNNEEFLWIVFNKQRHLIVQDLQGLIEKKDQPIFKNQDWIIENHFQSTGCFPLVAKGQTVGTFSLYTGSKYLFSPERIEFVEGVADLLASFILNMKLEKQNELQESLAYKNQIEVKFEKQNELQESLAYKNQIEAKLEKLTEKSKFETRFFSSITQKSIEEKFPGLSSDNYQVIDEATTKYNGLAWAIGEQEKDQWWSPELPEDSSSIYYWPHPVPREETLESYTKLFQLHGYSRCPGNDESFEPGFEKVAIYGKRGIPKHVARQLPDGRWTSKLGAEPCITHKTLTSLEGEVFGNVYRVLIRPRRQKNW